MKDTTAVLMASGKGTRLLPLTSTIPKSLVKVVGKSPLERNLDNLVGQIDEAVIVVGYLKEKIKNYFGNNYNGINIKYASQKKPKGTAHALWVARKSIKTKHILVMNTDDVYDKNLLTKALKAGPNAILGKKEKNWQNYGVLKSKKDNDLDKIVEKPTKFVGDLVNIGVYKASQKIFDYFKKIEKSKRGEYEITDMFTEFAKENPVKVVSCKSGWFPLSYPWDLLTLTETFLADEKESIEGKVEKGVTIKGKVVLGKNSIIKKGAYLEGDFYFGDNCVVGPNCFLKGFGSFGNGVAIGSAVEVTRSVVGDKTKIKHLSYIGDSVIGNHVNIGAGTVASNLRHDKENIKYEVKGKLTDTGRKKMGAVVGDHAKTGINTSLYPGTRLEAESTTDPGEVVKYQKS